MALRPELIPLVQMGLYVTACLTLFWALSGISLVAATVSAVLCLSLSALVAEHLTLQTESITASLLLFHVAAVAWAWRTNRALSLCAIGATVGLLMLIRPSTYFLLANLAILILIWRGGRLRATKLSLLSLFTVAGCGFLFSYAVRGIATQSATGPISLYTLVSDLWDPAKSGLPDNQKAVVVAARADMLAARNKAKSFRERVQANYLKNDVVVNQGPGFNAIGINSGNIPYMQLALEAIAHDPLGYLNLVAENICSAYLDFTLQVRFRATTSSITRTAENSDQVSLIYLSIFDQHRINIPFAVVDRARKVDDYAFVDAALDIFPGQSLPVTALAGALILIVGCFFKGPWTGISAIGAYAAATHLLGVGFTSVLAVFHSRYAIPLDPLATMHLT